MNGEMRRGSAPFAARLIAVTVLSLPSALAGQSDSILSRDLVVPGPIPLEAIFTAPADAAGPVPGLIIVHGSGGADKDLTFGPNRPYRDIAEGLARRGVAVLRYDKRTMAGPLWFLGKPFTVREETIDDAVSALALLRAQPEVDASRTFMIGHSLGGYLAPRIAAADGRLAGLILLAGAWVGPIHELMLLQLDYIVSVSDSSTAARIAGQRKAIGAAVEAIRQLTPADSSQLGSLLGAPAAYWLDLRGYDPVEALRARPEPVLMLQGMRDYQVTPRMLNEFVDSLGPRPATTVRRYPGLNHLFIMGDGRPRPADYLVAGTVSEAVLNDIAKWVNGQW